MKELKENFQICYFAPQNAKGEAMNLMSFGLLQLRDTFLYKNQEKLKQLCNNLSSNSHDFNEVSEFMETHLIDSIKIHICFENFLKGIFLINEVIIHKLDKEIFPELYKKQKKEPVYKNDLLRISTWEENPRVNLLELGLRKQIKGILKWTLGTNILTKKNYLDKIGFSQEILDIINPYLHYRNNLHYYTGESFTLSKSNYENFRKIIDFVNKNIVRIQNEIVDELQKGGNYKLNNI